jgi:hypothetical protein
MTGTEFDMQIFGTSLVVLGLAFLFSGLVFTLPSENRSLEKTFHSAEKPNSELDRRASIAPPQK